MLLLLRPFIFRHRNIHRPLQASLFELRPDKSLETQRSQRNKFLLFAAERAANKKSLSLCDLSFITRCHRIHIKDFTQNELARRAVVFHFLASLPCHSFVTAGRQKVKRKTYSESSATLRWIQLLHSCRPCPNNYCRIRTRSRRHSHRRSR